MSNTSIGVSKESLKKWKEFKNHPDESYEHMINRILNQFDEDDILTEEDLKDIQESLDDFKAGRVHTMAEVKKELGLK